MNIQTQVAKNAREFITNNNKRGATIARICGEEHSAIAEHGTANIWLTCDNDLCYISDYKFKIIFNGGSSTAWENIPVGTKWITGYNTWPNVDAFKTAYPLGSALNVDGKFGCQCVDYANAFWVGMVGRQISCGGANARGIWENARSYNAGTEFETGTNWSSIKPGDWVVWGNSEYGHIAMAVASPSGTQLQVWEQNGANGTPWPEGGKTLAASTLKQEGFLGYFRYKGWN